MAPRLRRRPALIGRRLIGRRDELARLLALAPSTEPRLALLTGEPGIGKTFLAATAAEHLEASGAAVLRTYATQGSASQPFDVFRSAVAEWVGGWNHVPDQLVGRSDAVTQLLGPIAPHLPPRPIPPSEELAWIGAEIVLHLAADGPVVVVLDDIHLADAESLNVFERLLWIHDATLIVATIRSGALERHNPVSEWLGRIDRRLRTEIINVVALDSDATRSLLAELTGTSPGDRAVRELWDRTGGNPLFLTELVRTHPGVSVDDLANRPLPMNLAVLVVDQLESLDDGARSTLERLAVVGQRVNFDLLAAVNPTDERELLADIRTLTAAGLIHESRPDVFEFRHALLRQAVLDSVPYRQRRGIQELALAAEMASAQPDAASVVRYAQGAGRRDEVLLAARSDAGPSLWRGEFHRAFSLAEAGLEHDPDDTDLLETAARAAWVLGLYRDSRAYAECLRQLGCHRADSTLTARAVSILLRLAWEASDEPWRAGLEAELLALEPTLPDVERAPALAALTQTVMLTERYERVAELADRTIALAESIGDEISAIHARIERASSRCAMSFDDELPTREMLEALVDARRIGDLVLVARGIHNLIFSVSALAPEAEDDLIEELLRVGERIGANSLIGLRPEILGSRQAFRDGDLAASVKIAEGITTQDPLRWLLLKAPVLFEVGRADEVLSVLQGQSMQPSADSHLYHAVAAALTGTDEQVRNQKTASSATLVCESSETYALASLGLLDAASVSADRLAAIAPILSGAWLTEFGRAVFDVWDSARQGRHAEALKYSTALVERLSPTMRLPKYLTADIEHRHARLLASAGHRDEARETIRRALAQLALWPGVRRDAMAMTARALGTECDEPTTGCETVGLTRREREVAGLVARGLTNGQIAEALYIARKTASVHVSNILAKLGLSTRSAIAAWAVTNLH